MSFTPTQSKRKQSATWGLIVGFTPFVTIQIVAMCGVLVEGPNWIFGVLCFLSAGCCFTSSFLMFKQKQTWATVIGILFLVVNALIALAIGFAPLIRGFSALH
jgi:hypothetical protein